MGAPTQEEWINARIKDFKDIFSVLEDEQLSLMTEWISTSLDSAWKRGHQEGYKEAFEK